MSISKIIASIEAGQDRRARRIAAIRRAKLKAALSGARHSLDAVSPDSPRVKISVARVSLPPLTDDERVS